MEIFKTTIKEYASTVAIQQQLFQYIQMPMNYPDFEQSFTTKVKDFLSELRDELVMIIESDYVDKVYRDSYYNHYATKQKGYSRNCLRISFFEPIFNDINEYITKDDKLIEEAYLGFLVIRPIEQCVGRNAISPKAKISTAVGIKICQAPIKSTCIGRKLTVWSFPHSSQDAEHMSCAENAIWSLLEYYGSKYDIYSPILPSQIIDTLSKLNVERLIPTTGLKGDQIAIALKDHGFAPIIYYKSNPRFQELFSCYIESGIPLIAIVAAPANDFCHAIVTIGRECIDRSKVNTFEAITLDKTKHKVAFYNKFVENFVVNDDNHPNYKRIEFSDPAKKYGLKAEITAFFVPFYDKIYLPAEKAIHITNAIAFANFTIPDDTIIRTFMTSCRSYRDYIRGNEDLQVENKEALLMIDMPRFVWITEFSSKSAFDKKKVNGVLILDATGNTRSKSIIDSFIYGQYLTKAIVYNNKKKIFEIIGTTLPSEYKCFEGNLK